VSRGTAAVAIALALAGSGALVAQGSTCQPHLLGADRRGPARAIARSGTMVYLGAGAALVVIDATDPENPVERGYANLGGVVRDVASWGWTAIALIPDALEIVNADDPLLPHVVGSFPLPAEWDVKTIDARDGMVFFAGPDGLHIVSFENPADPIEIGTFEIAAAGDVAARPSRAYLLAGGTLHVLDTSDPAAPVELAAVAVPLDTGEAVTVAPSGLRLATWGAYSNHHSWGSVAFFDLANPDLPVERSVLDFCCDDDPPRAVAFAAGRAYVRHWADVEIYDLSDLSDPVLERRFGTASSGPLFGAPDPEYLLVADDWNGLRVYDVVPPSSAHEVAAVETAGEALDGYFVERLAVTTHAKGIRTYDVSNPEHPILIGTGATTATALTGEVRRTGSFAYSLAFHQTSPQYDFAIFDLTDTGAPVQIGSFGSSTSPSALVVDRQVAIWLLYGSSTPVLDLSDPSQPVQVASLGSGVWDAALAGDRAHVWTSVDPQTDRLWTFDLSQPAAPVLLGATDLPDRFRSTSAVVGSRLFVCGGSEFAIYDIADPSDGQLLGSLQVAYSHLERRISPYGARVFLSPDYATWPQPRTFRVLDVSDPTHPNEIAAIQAMAVAKQVFVGPGLIGVADGEAGVAFYDSCVPFADGFESGDTSRWSENQP